MAYYNKIGLLVLSPDQTKFLVCKKNSLKEYILPGGKIESGEDHIQCIQREIREELSVEVDLDSLEYIGDYTHITAGDTTKDVNIKLYSGNLIGNPLPSQEIVEIHWVDAGDNNLSSMIADKIIPDIKTRNILK